MRNAAWAERVEMDDEQAPLEHRQPLVVSLHFVRAALRRRLLLCAISPLLGLLVATGLMVVFPPSHAARASLVLTYDSQQDSGTAMDTNLSLFQTETLARLTIARLGLPMTPEAFRGSLTVEKAGSQLLQLTLTAPSDAEAVRRLDALTTVYLEFRAEQLSYQTQVVVAGLQDRVTKLQGDVRDLSDEIDQLSRNDNTDPGKLSDLIAQRGSIQGRIDELGQQIEDATLRNAAVVASSRVLDPPTPVAGRAARDVALWLASGLIGGAALVCGTVLFAAITSTRVRRRADLAEVLGVPVRVSVGRVRPLPRALVRVLPLQAVDARRTAERERLVHAINREVLRPGRRACLAFAGTDHATDLGLVIAGAAKDLVSRGYRTTVVDLTRDGSRGLLRLPPDPDAGLLVLRPRGVPALLSGLEDLHPVGTWEDDATASAPELGQATLVLAELEPAVGAEHLSLWTDRVVLAVTAGGASVEKIRTVGDQVRAAGLDLRFAALLGADRTDESAGTVPEPMTGQSPRPSDADEPQTRHELPPVERFEAL